MNQRPYTKRQRQKLLEDLARLEHWTPDEYYKRMTDLDNEYLRSPDDRVVAIIFAAVCAVELAIGLVAWLSRN